MSRKKFGAIVILVLSAVTMALLAPSVSGQATAPPPNSTSSGSTTTPAPKPRAPTNKDLAELKAAMNWPGSTLIGVAIVANFAEACFMKSPENKSMLATITSGKWEKIHETGGCYTAEDIVQAVPSIPPPIAEELEVHATLSRVDWYKGDRAAAESSDNFRIRTFSHYQMEGNVAAMRGDFDGAIEAWTKAQALDVGDVKSCRGEFQRMQIQAAKDAQARMDTLHLTKSEAAEWYDHRSTELWVRNCCDIP